jgi:extracellular factor (EF) 3-hydroxypalmitic acid methyl ester biosynthesis protein
MVNMIARQPYEGSSLFAKVVNSWFLSQWPARAHRNRIQYLKSLLAAEALRGAARGRPMRVLNLGCGPAWEIQGFLAESALADFAQFTLLDFNEETLQHVRAVMEQLKRQYGRRTSFQFQRKSVLHVLKEGAKPLASSAEREFDLIYCAGLFDYLPDRTCKQLMSIFYERLAPGGLLAVTNVDDYKPFRHMLEFVLDWNLIYRDARKSVSLFADRIPPETYSIRKDSTGVNVFLEARKESDGR